MELDFYGAAKNIEKTSIMHLLNFNIKPQKDSVPHLKEQRWDRIFFGKYNALRAKSVRNMVFMTIVLSFFCMSVFLGQLTPLSSVYAQLPPGNRSTIAFLTEATHRGIQLELKRVDLLDELPDGTKPNGEYFLVLFGTLRNLGDDSGCVYRSDFRLVSNGGLFTLSRKHRLASNVYEIEYPSAARGQCVEANEESTTLLLFDSGESTEQTTSSTNNSLTQVDSAVVLFGSEIMVIPTFDEMISAANEKVKDDTAVNEQAKVEKAAEEDPNSGAVNEPEKEKSTPEATAVEQNSVREVPTATNTSELTATNTSEPTVINIATIESTDMAKQTLFEGVDRSTVEQATVIKIISGMQIEAEINKNPVTVCYLGIQAPANGEAYFEESYAANVTLVLGKDIYLYHDNASQSTTNCLQRYVYLEDGMFVNEAIVKQGWAAATEEMNGVIYGRNLKDAERAAQKSNLGIWNADSAVVSAKQLSSSAKVSPTTTAIDVPTSVPPTPVLPTATETVPPTPVLPTATETVSPTSVPPTPVPPTAMETVPPTSVPPTSVPPTSVPPTPVPPTPVPPTSVPPTPVPPTSVPPTSVPPTSVPPTPVPPTSVPPTSVPPTPVPPTSVPPTSVPPTPVPPTSVPPTPVPPTSVPPTRRAASGLIGPSITPVRPTPVSTIQIQLSTP